MESEKKYYRKILEDLLPTGVNYKPRIDVLEFAAKLMSKGINSNVFVDLRIDLKSKQYNLGLVLCKSGYMVVMDARDGYVGIKRNDPANPMNGGVQAVVEMNKALFDFEIFQPIWNGLSGIYNDESQKI